MREYSEHKHVDCLLTKLTILCAFNCWVISKSLYKQNLVIMEFTVSNISRTLGNKIADHSDADAAPTTSSFST